MAILANTYLTFSAVGNREDLMNKIVNISPIDTPFQSMAEESTAKATLHEWQIDALATAAANAQLQGDDISFAAAVPTSRISNRTQILRKEVIVSGTQEAVDKAGRDGELVYQMSKKRKELKRDKEFVLCSNQAPVTGNSTTAPQLRPLCGWFATNVDRGATGASGSTVAAATDGAQRALTLAMINTGQQNAFIQGGEPSYLMCGPKQRVAVTAIMGAAATKFYAIEDKKLVNTIQAYEGDFGLLKVITNRFMRGGQTGADREIFGLDPSLWAVSYLQGRKSVTIDVAKTGDSEKGVQLCELTLEARQEAGNFVIADIV